MKCCDLYSLEIQQAVGARGEVQLTLVARDESAVVSVALSDVWLLGPQLF